MLKQFIEIIGAKRALLLGGLLLIALLGMVFIQNQNTNLTDETGPITPIEVPAIDSNIQKIEERLAEIERDTETSDYWKEDEKNILLQAQEDFERAKEFEVQSGKDFQKIEKFIERMEKEEIEMESTGYEE